MKKYEPFKRMIRLVSSFILVILLVVIYMNFWYKQISPSTGVWYWRKGNWVIAGLYTALVLFFITMYGGFRLGDLEKGNVIYSQILSIIFVNFITYIQIALLAYHFPKIGMFIMLTICEIIAIVLWTQIYSIIYQYLFPPRELLLVYGNERAAELLGKLKKREDRYKIEKLVSIAVGDEEIVKMAESYDGVILCDLPVSSRNFILKECFERSVRVYMTPEITDILIKTSREMHTFDTPLLLSRNSGLSLEQQIAKRSLDVVVSVLMLVAASPIMLFTALAVKLYDGGSIIYKQKRLTMNGREFYVYKFRSMRMDAEKDGIARLASEGDKRITPVGKVIRMTRLDELPQLINVLKGEMSLVGPRPERPEIAQKYELWLPQFKSRLKVKAGLTGYAQIYGKYNTTPYDKLKLDLIYIQNYSFILDLKLLMLTIKILFMKESTEGVDSPANQELRIQDIEIGRRASAANWISEQNNRKSNGWKHRK